jgi:hypothetical protein
LTFPVARYRQLSTAAIIQEMIDCNRIFYSMPAVLRRVWTSFWRRREPLINLVTNLSTRNNSRVERKAYADFQERFPVASPISHHLPSARTSNLGRDGSASGLA